MESLDTYMEADFLCDPVETDKSMVDTGYRSSDYILMIAENKEGEDVYQLINRRFGVVEYEDHFLPRTVNMMVELQQHCDEANAKYWRGNIKTIDGGKSNDPFDGALD